MQHILKKQIIQLSVDKKLDPFHMQQRMSELYMQEVLPVLEKFFDEAADEDQTLYIDSLEIDLGVISEKELSRKNWREALLIKLAKKCEEKLNTRQRAQEQTSQMQQKIVNICQQWIFYMEKGYLPWNALHVTEEWKQKVLEALAVDFSSIETLRKLIKSNSKALSRIVKQHTEAFLLQLMEIMTAKEQSKALSLFNELEEILLFFFYVQPTSDGTSKARLRNELWCHVLYLAAEHKEKANDHIIGQYILQKYLANPADLQMIMPRLGKELPLLFPIIKQWKGQAASHREKQKKDSLEEQQRELKNKKRIDAVDQDPKDKRVKQKKGEAKQEQEKTMPTREDRLLRKEIEISSQEPSSELSGAIKEGFAKAKEVDSGKENGPMVIDEEGIFVVYAGVVLLHPFLSMFFSRLELLKEGKFKDESAHQKALYLLHYLTTGEATAEECDLVVPKVLTAYPLEEPVEKDIFLSEEESEEADHLLKEVIRQWEILKNTSPDELRGGFLQRKAKLFTKNDSLYLQFETDSIDVLLDYLPWNLNIIKLPWMQDFLHVEWR